jgi:ribosome-binding factor A
MSGHRSTRVAEAIKEEVGAILLHRLKDSRVQSERVSITNVEVSGDLRHATIFVSILGEEDLKHEALQGLKSASGFIRREVGAAIKLRSTPEIHFKLDSSLEHGANIAALLNRIKQESEQQAAERSSHEAIGGEN